MSLLNNDGPLFTLYAMVESLYTDGVITVVEHTEFNTAISRVISRVMDDEK